MEILHCVRQMWKENQRKSSYIRLAIHRQHILYVYKYIYYKYGHPNITPICRISPNSFCNVCSTHLISKCVFVAYRFKNSTLLEVRGLACNTVQ